MIAGESTSDRIDVSWNSTSKDCVELAGPFAGDANEIYFYYVPSATGTLHELRIYTVETTWDRA